MENNLDNKAKFFAQYWGQDVLLIPDDEQTWNIYEDAADSEHGLLLLNPLSSITDEDALIVLECEYLSKQSILEILIRDKTTAKEHWLRSFDAIGFLTQYESDYLRSKGYALPWMGLSVETLVEYGWVKLKTE